MLTATDICNRALDKLGAETINSILAPQLVNEKRCSRIYPVTKARELKRHPWLFARKETQLAPLSTQTLKGLSRYPLPPDCLRPLREDTTTWRVAGRELLDVASSALYLEYIANVDESLFDEAFIEVLACKLAEELAEPITQNASKAAAMRQAWQDALAEARRDNAFSVGDENLSDSDIGFGWVTERF